MSGTGVDIQVNLNMGNRLLSEPEVVLAPNAVLKVVGARYLQWIDDNFRAQGIERKWAPLRPLTLQLRKHGGSTPLQDSGQLKQSFVEAITAGAGSVRVGTEKVYASYHQEGVGPFKIVAKNARSLAALMRSGGWIFFGKEVNHPGIPARPMIPSQALAEKLAEETVQAMFDLEASRGST